MYIAKDGKSFYLYSTGTNGEFLWGRRLVKGDDDLFDLTFTETELDSYSLGHVVWMSSGGERLYVWLRNTGEFRFFFHSW